MHGGAGPRSARRTRRQERDELVGERFVAFVDALPIGVLILDLVDPDDPRSFQVRATNPAMQGMAPVRLDRMIGRPLVDAFPTERIGISGIERLLRRLAITALDGTDFDVELDVRVHRSGDLVTVHLRAVPIPGRSVALLVEDITARVRAEQALAHRASHDHLTGLANRSELMDRVERAMAQRDGRAVTLLMIDLDRFKDVNDTFGHERGDELLQRVAERMTAVVSPGSVIARLGGDEFAVLLPTGATTPDGIAAALAIEEALAAPVSLGALLPIEVGASIGIASAPVHAVGASDLVVRADMAMYAAKRAGGGEHAVYSPNLDRGSVRRLVLLGDLRRAVASGELVLHYQPIVDARTGRIVSLEGLVRWYHPELGLVMPSEFIELVELGTLSRPLALLVVRQALAQLRTWRGLGHDVGVNLNLTPRNLADRELIETLVHLVEAEALPPGLVTVELTERQLLEDLDAGLLGLERLHGAGVRVSIDDFGTGASSLWLLRRLTVDELKIDRAFVADVRSGQEAVVRAVVELAHSLGMTVVAEGVEDPVTRHRLQELGCDLLQGFVIGRPLPADELLRTLLGDPTVAVT